MTRAEFGIKIPTFPSDNENSLGFIRRLLKFVRETETDFKTIWVADHLTPWIKGLSSLDMLECWTTVCYLAGLFPHRGFGTAVLNNSFRYPALVAKMSATLDELSRGRFILGIGAGWREQEYIEYGYSYEPPAVRIGQLSEGVQIIRKLWSEDKCTFNGRYFKVNNLTCCPHPEPPPPIMIGGGGEKLTLRVVAKYADWWNTLAVSPEHYNQKLSVLASHCDKVDRKFSSIRKTAEVLVSLGRTKEEAERKVLTGPHARGRAKHFVGTPKEAATFLGGFVDLGVDYFIVRFLDEPSIDGAKLFANEVISNL